MKNIQQTDVFNELLQLLKLEKIEKNIYRGQSQDLGFGNVFGGQVVGQALSAASRTVDGKYHAHSLHCYFMLAGDASNPVVYTVDRIRDGRSFVTRRVVAVQNGRAIFSMSASFHAREEGFEHHEPMPAIKDPEHIESDIEIAGRLAHRFPTETLDRLMVRKPIEIRVVNPVNPLEPEAMPPEKYVWFRAAGILPDDKATHRYVLAYASDFHLVGTCLYPHSRTFWSPDMMVASLDHSLWFHREFRMDDWFLYAMKSPSACAARGLCFGRIYTRDGRLVASVAQEGLIRQLKQRTSPPA